MYHTKEMIPNDLLINHIDGVKTNNRMDNLECVTASENSKHAFRTGLNMITDAMRKEFSNRTRGSKNPHAKLNDDLVIYYRQKFKSGEIKKKDIANELGVSLRTVYHFLDGSTWSHLNEIESPITNK